MATTLASGTPPPAKETMNGSRGIGAAKPHAYEILIIVIFQCRQTKVKKKNYGKRRQSFKQSFPHKVMRHRSCSRVPSDMTN